MRQLPWIAVIGTGLISVLGWQCLTGIDPASDLEPTAARRAPRPAVAPPSAARQAGFPLADAEAIVLARPLFSRDRRPTAEKVAAASPAPDLNTLPRLYGVLIGPDERRALFVDASGKSTSALEGGTVGRYTVRNIQLGRVVVDGPDGERVLNTTYANAAGASVTPR